MRIEKVAILDEVIARVKDSDYCFIINHGGATVAQMSSLRGELRKCESRLLVVKNTYLAKVAKEKGWSEEVNAMFAGQTAIVTGKEKLSAATVCAYDLRAGAALVIAGLAAEGKTVVENIHFIERGYENIVQKLTALGADIKRVED